MKLLSRAAIVYSETFCFMWLLPSSSAACLRQSLFQGFNILQDLCPGGVCFSYSEKPEAAIGGLKWSLEGLLLIVNTESCLCDFMPRRWYKRSLYMHAMQALRGPQLRLLYLQSKPVLTAEK